MIAFHRKQAAAQPEKGAASQPACCICSSLCSPQARAFDEHGAACRWITAVYTRLFGCISLTCCIAAFAMQQCMQARRMRLCVCFGRHAPICVVLHICAGGHTAVTLWCYTAQQPLDWLRYLCVACAVAPASIMNVDHAVLLAVAPSIAIQQISNVYSSCLTETPLF